METSPVPENFELEIANEELSYAEAIAQEISEIGAVETVGKTRQERLDEIRHADDFRRELRAQAFEQMRTFLRDNSDLFMVTPRLSSEGSRALRTERRRRNYVERYEEVAEADIQALIGELDLEDFVDQVTLARKLAEEYFALKTRLVVVEMETRRLMHRLYEGVTGVAETKEERFRRVVGNAVGPDAEAHEIILLEIDDLRDQQLDDRTIFRQLLKKYHPDVSDREDAITVTRLLITLYNTALKKFRI